MEKYSLMFSDDHDKFSYAINGIINMRDFYKSSLENESQLNMLFSSFNKELISSKPNYFDQHYFETVYNSLKNSKGIMLANFLNIGIFRKHFRQNISNFKTSIEKLLSGIERLMLELLEKSSSEQFEKFPKFIEYINSVTKNLVSTVVGKLKSILDTIIESENITFTQNPTYIETIETIKESDKLPEFIQNNLDTSNTKHVACEMIISLAAYHKVVINRLSDTIPMVVCQILLNEFTNILSDKASKIDISLIQESPELIADKKEKETLLKSLNESISLIK